MTDDTECHMFLLRRRPDGVPSAEDFTWRAAPMPQPEAGEVVLRTLFLSIDPYMRGRISDRASYTAPVAIGAVMTGETVGQVVASAAPGFAVGDLAVGGFGWQTHCQIKAAYLTKLDPAGPPISTYLGVLGMPGVTAYTAMQDIGCAKPGETVVVSAASGAVGSVAGQLAKRAGARVVGVAGGAEKCAFVREVLGFDDCVDHRGADLPAALAAACPKGVDVYVENVGGATQAAVFPLLNLFARVIVIGLVSQYNAPTPPPGPNLGIVLARRLRVQGVLVSDKPERFAEWRALAAPWLSAGSLKYREHIIDGLENAPAALAGQLDGKNFGKLLIRVAQPSPEIGD